MDFELTKEQHILQQIAKEYAKKNLEPLAEVHERDHYVPLEVYQDLGKAGLMGLPISEEYGGSGGGFDGYVLCLEQICKANTAVSGAITGHTLPMAVVDTFGTEEQKKWILPPGCSGEQIHSFAFTEPGTGSDPKQITSTAKKDGDSWILNGTKRFISNAHYPGVLGVIVKDADSEGLCLFLVDKTAPGYSISERWEKIANSGQGLYDVYLKDCKVPAANLVGNVGDAFKILVSGIGYGKLGISAQALATAQSAYELALDFATQKLHRGKPITKFQAIQLMIGEMAEKLEACRLMVYKAALIGNKYSKSDFVTFAKTLALTKNFVSQNAIDIVRIAMNIHASYGLMKEYKIERLWRMVIMAPQIEGGQHMQRIIAANAIIDEIKNTGV